MDDVLRESVVLPGGLSSFILFTFFQEEYEHAATDALKVPGLLPSPPQEPFPSVRGCTLRDSRIWKES